MSFLISGFEQLQRSAAGLFRATKDQALAAAARRRLNPLLSDFGEMLNLSIDTEAKSVRCSLQLKGEPAPLDITVAKYDLLKQDGRTFLEVDSDDITTSKEWITVLLHKTLDKHRYEIPAKWSWVVELLV
jgi:hypothetical protein